MNTQEAFKRGWNCHAAGATHRTGHSIYREHGQWFLEKVRMQGETLVKDKPLKLNAATLSAALDAAARKL